MIKQQAQRLRDLFDEGGEYPAKLKNLQDQIDKERATLEELQKQTTEDMKKANKKIIIGANETQ